MINLKLLDLVKESLPHFDGENSSDLIKAEKILKAQQKIDSEFSLNDIENFISFFKENGKKYYILLADENLIRILRKENFKINSSKNKIFEESETTQIDFGNDFAEDLKDYIQQSIMNDNWENLRIFYKNYFPIINFDNENYLMNVLTSKNSLVRLIIPKPYRYNYFLNQYKHLINPHFYALQSDINSSYFNNQILSINNDITDNQNLDTHLKVILGKILVALGNFDAYSESLRETLKKNSKIGAYWASKDIMLYTKASEKPVQTNERFIKRNKVEKHNFNWIGTILYFLITIIIFTILCHKSFNLLLIVLIIELIIYLCINKNLKIRFEKKYPKKDASASGKLKKIIYKFLQTQLYTLSIFASIAFLCGVIALCFAIPLLGIPLAFGTGLLIRHFKNQ